ncbi:hypothetical protein LW14_22060, partial [Rhizobium sp. H41]
LFNNIRVDLDPTVGQEDAKAIPVFGDVGKRFAKRRFASDAGTMMREPVPRVCMILQQAIVLGLIGFVVGKITATFAAPLFPKFVLLLSADTIIGVIVVIAICALASIVAIRMALKVDPAEAIGG